MPMSTHDPYLATVKRTLQEKQQKEQKKEFIEKQNQVKRKSFFQQSIDLNDHIYLPESLQKTFALGVFIFIPYTIGLLFLFFVVAHADFQTYEDMGIDSYLLPWTIGYECIATLLIMSIIKSAVHYSSVPIRKEVKLLEISK